MHKRFSGKTVLISGGLGDIGRAIAIAFAECGAAVAVGDVLSAARAVALQEALQPYGVPFRYTEVDVSNAAAVQRWVGEVEETLGVASIVIVNAATVTLKDLSSINAEEWNRELSINLNGAFYVSQAATVRLLEWKQPGRVVFIGSWAGHVPHSHIPAYSVSKAAIRMLCKCMALELAAHQILVNELALGFVNAGLSAAVWRAQPETGANASNKVPVGQVISPYEVARQVVYLCDPDNTQMTGSTLLMDGGLSLQSGS